MKSLAAALALALSACAGLGRDAALPASATACGPGVAQIQILDGMAKRLCGCAEPDDTLIAPPASVDCTVAVGTRVHFRFEGTFREHQIVFTGAGMDDLHGHVVQPEEPVTRRPHVVLFDTATTSYPFRDGFNSAVNGSIIVP